MSIAAFPKKTRLARFFDVLHYATVGVLATSTAFLAFNLGSVVQARRRHLKEAEAKALAAKSE